jgi:6-phosphogluconolactonase
MPDEQIVLHDFADRTALAVALAARIADALAAAIADHGTATIAVSGGSTPALLFRQLAQAPIDWSKVVVTLVDERFVAPDSPRSNQRLVTDTLLTGAAASARFVPLYRPETDLDGALARSSDALSELRWPLDVVVLGMGTDGHTASFFPDAPNLDEMLVPSSGKMLHSVLAPSGGEPRLTLSVARIASARLPVLHIEGAEKHALLQRVLSGEVGAPIGYVLGQMLMPTHIYWAP